MSTGTADLAPRRWAAAVEHEYGVTGARAFSWSKFYRLTIAKRMSTGRAADTLREALSWRSSPIPRHAGVPRSAAPDPGDVGQAGHFRRLVRCDMKRGSEVMSRFRPIEPFESGMIDVGGGHRVYWECCGNPIGKPSLFLHGGPGSGCSPGSTTTRREVEWITSDVGRIFPREWARFVAAAPTICEIFRSSMRTPRCCSIPITRCGRAPRESGVRGKTRILACPRLPS
jgi:hypothetical protein